MKIEARAYGPASTPAEVEMLRSRISMYSEDIVLWHEVPVLSPFQFEVMAHRMGELTSPLERFGFLVDATVGGRPGAADRRRIRDLLTGPIGGRAYHVSLVGGGNMGMLLPAATFVMRVAGMKRFSIHKTREEAVEAIERAR